MLALSENFVWRMNGDAEISAILGISYPTKTMADDDQLVVVGDSTYYPLRKGHIRFLILQGKKMDSDPEHTWEICGPPGGKRWFVNRAQQKRWHLPDVYQTPEAAAREKTELLARKLAREQQGAQEEERRRRRQEKNESKSRNSVPQRQTEKFQIGESEVPEAGEYVAATDESDDRKGGRSCPSCCAIA